MWDKLPEHIKADLEIQQYRRCLKHYNLSCHHTHIVGPPPLIKNCSECQWLRRLGRGLLNRAISARPIELPILGYQFYGPGTHLEKRLARDDQNINPLDATCREHDITYSHSNDLANRHEADNMFATKAWERITAKDSIFEEKNYCYSRWATMKAKKKLEMDLKTKRKKKEKREQRINEYFW